MPVTSSSLCLQRHSFLSPPASRRRWDNAPNLRFFDGLRSHPRHSGESPLLSRKNVLSSCAPQRAALFPANSMLPIRRPGEGRGPVTLTIFKSLGDSLHSPLRGRPFGRSPRFALRPAFAGTTIPIAICARRKIFLGQQWANAGMTNGKAFGKYSPSLQVGGHPSSHVASFANSSGSSALSIFMASPPCSSAQAV